MIDYMMELIRFRELAVLKDDVQVVKKGLDFLRYIGDEYMRLEVYNDQYYDGEDFGLQEVRKGLAATLRHEELPIDVVRHVRDEIARIRKMEAYAGYGLLSFDDVDEALSYRLDDPDTYLAGLDKMIRWMGRDYLEMMEGKESMSLYIPKELGQYLLKKVDYLRMHGRDEEADKVIRDFCHVPDIRSMIINKCLEKGNDEAALAAIDEGIGFYGDDCFNTTAKWHKQKITLLEKKGDVKGIIGEYRCLFCQYLSDKQTYYEKLKSLVPHEEWKAFASDLFDGIRHLTDEECILVCGMIVAEGLDGCLFKLLMKNQNSFNCSDIFSRYAAYLSEEEQGRFIGMVIDRLRGKLGYAKSNRYGYIVKELKVLYDSCAIGQRMISEFVSDIRSCYGRRSALMRYLKDSGL